LGLLVEEISGQPFDDYMDEHILQTLRMEQSSFSQSPSSQDSMAVSYRFENGEYLSQPFFSTHSVPAAGLSSTGMDIAAFMIAHLEGGRFGSATILQHSTVDEMQRQHFTYDPHLPGMAYGFKERLVAGQPRAIWHDGHNAGRVCAMLTLVPEEAFGFFIAYNADDGCVLATDVREQLMDHYYPKGEPVPRQPSPVASGQLSNQIAGVYRFTNYAHETVVKLLTLEWEDYPRISMSLDSPLEVVFYEGDGDEGRFRYIEVAPLLFKSVNTEGNEESYVWFKEDATGEITGFTFDSKFFFERVNWYEHIRLQKGLFLLFGLGFFITLAILLVLRITRRSHDSTPVGKLERWEMRLVATIAAANLLFLVLILLALIYRSQLGIEFDTGMPTFLAAVFVLPILTTLLAVVLLFVVGRAWAVNSWSVDRRIAYSLFTVLALAFVPFLQYWNLLGFNW
jgi:hypothetical protein